SASSKKHVSKARKKSPESGTPPPNKDISSSRKHSMDYVTVNGVFLRTGHAEKIMWYLLCLKELWDNAIDFLWKYYQGATNATIETEITKTNDSMLHVKIRNTNSKNIPVFQNLSAVFDFEMRYGSKQNQRIISRGILGDAMKQILSWPYVLIHTTNEGNNRNGFVDKQWDKPLIIRHNGLEHHILLHVDKANQTIESHIKPLPTKLPHTDTAIEYLWPIINDVNLDIHDVEEFCRLYPILTTDISFKFRLVDNSKAKTETSNNTATTKPARHSKKKNKNESIASELVNVLSSPAPKATIKIEYPALHPIATGWKNISSIHSYYPEEFLTTLTSIYDKQSTLVYDVLKTFREGSNLEKTEDNKMPLAELMSDPDRNKKIEGFFYRLRGLLDPPKRLSLPYTVNQFSKRGQPLVDRIVQLYCGLLNLHRAVYKAMHGFYEGKGISYPFVFEMAAIPYNNESLEGNHDRPTKFFGFVNYSISPKGNKFEGNYQWEDKKYYTHYAHDIIDVLQQFKFNFNEYASARTKLPCIIVANLISPRIDYHGHDKSRIDTAPFEQTILHTVRKVTEGIQTFQAAGWHFISERKRELIVSDADKNITTEYLLTEFLEERMSGER
ncbi:MAG: hypothetical protein WCA39_11195, partial [Nitrososphaeraceae archaeon]